MRLRVPGVPAVDVYYGWYVATACFFVGVITFGTIYSFSVFFERLLDEFDRSHADTAFIFSLQSLVMYGSAAVLGTFIDRYGRRRMLFVALALVTIGLLGTSQARTMTHVLVLYSLVAATGMGIQYVISYATIPHWFSRRLGLANGLATAGASVGILVAPPAVTFVIERVGWRSAYVALTVVSVVVLLVAIYFIRDSPRDVAVDLSIEFPDGEPPAPATTDWREQGREVWRVVRSPSFVAVFIGILCIYTPMYALLVHLVSYSSTAGIGRWVGVLGISLIGATGGIGRLVIGHLSDYAGIVLTFIVSGACIGAATMLFPTVPTAAFVIIIAFVFGLGQAGAGALLSPMLARIFGGSNLNTVFGIASLALGVSGSVGPYLGGLGYDIFGVYGPTFGVLGLVGIIGSGLVIVGRRTRDSVPTD